MSAGGALPGEIREQLNDAVDRLEAAAGGLTPHGLVLGVPHRVVRAWVWAQVRGRDPTGLMLRAHFGKMAVGPGAHQAVASWAWALEAANARG